ncbi:MAG: hypothetical protein H9901_05395 [Candidatus Paralactobacillus gallistercoris]|uniref:Uncharacterized protein n=1 Tax=Candidatus Paralactobacillus gallistercoris TaxID=2838724 RepID=A0A948TK77_9LACO|nr:hypothetical protein [Candidatus Paralactobacillus gallistercoris]
MKKYRGMILSESIISLLLSLLTLIILALQLQATTQHLHDRVNNVQLKQVAVMALRELQNTQNLNISSIFLIQQHIMLPKLLMVLR